MLSKIAFALGLILMINVEAVNVQLQLGDETDNGEQTGDTPTQAECEALKDDIVIKTAEYSFNAACQEFTATKAT